MFPHTPGRASISVCRRPRAHSCTIAQLGLVLHVCTTTAPDPRWRSFGQRTQEPRAPPAEPRAPPAEPRPAPLPAARPGGGCRWWIPALVGGGRRFIQPELGSLLQACLFFPFFFFPFQDVSLPQRSWSSTEAASASREMTDSKL